MAQINVIHLTFGYEGSFDTIFENVSFSIDTAWKLGLLGRNGKGKTTFLRLLQGRYEYEGTISTSTMFDYFPYPVQERELERTAAELMEKWKTGAELWRVLCELETLGLEAELLYRSFGTLSQGEKTTSFLLMNRPTIWTEIPERLSRSIWLPKRDLFWYPMTEICWMPALIMYWC